MDCLHIHGHMHVCLRIAIYMCMCTHYVEVSMSKNGLSAHTWTHACMFKNRHIHVYVYPLCGGKHE